MKSKITIIIPVYNGERYLEQCWKSLKLQSYKNIEYIFIDDCSTDHSYNKLLKIRQEDSRVKIFQNKENLGVSNTRNLGIKLATGEYLSFCDCDDTMNHDMIESMYLSLYNNDCDISCCGINRVEENGKLIEQLWKSTANYKMSNSEAIHNWLVGNKIGNSVVSKMIKKELFKNVEFPSGEIFEEAYVIPKLFKKSKGIIHCGMQAYNYISRKGSITRSGFSDKQLVVYKRIDYIKALLGAKYKDEIICFEARQYIPMYMSAIIYKKNISIETFKDIKKRYNSIVIKAISNKYVSIKLKLNIIEISFGIFKLRKNKLIKLINIGEKNENRKNSKRNE